VPSNGKGHVTNIKGVSRTVC